MGRTTLSLYIVLPCIMHRKPLPSEEDEFHALVHAFFPSIYDMKFMCNFHKDLKYQSGLEEIANQFGV